MEFIVTGSNSYQKFLLESGGHRFQRVPETEKRGRRQTSTVTVAVLPIIQNQYNINYKDLKWETTSGSTAGGQHAQKNETCVRLTHKPSGICIICKDERSQKRNKDKALDILSARLHSIQEEKMLKDKNDVRSKQIGLGKRGDKIRTYRFQDSIVKNNLTNKKCNLEKILKGEIDIIQ